MCTHMCAFILSRKGADLRPAPTPTPFQVINLVDTANLDFSASNDVGIPLIWSERPSERPSERATERATNDNQC